MSSRTRGQVRGFPFGLGRGRGEIQVDIPGILDALRRGLAAGLRRALGLGRRSGRRAELRARLLAGGGGVHIHAGDVRSGYRAHHAERGLAGHSAQDRGEAQGDGSGHGSAVLPALGPLRLLRALPRVVLRRLRVPRIPRSPHVPERGLQPRSSDLFHDDWQRSQDLHLAYTDSGLQFSRMVISTRRLRARPASVSLLAIGRSSP